MARTVIQIVSACGGFASLSALAVILTILGLSSCAGIAGSAPAQSESRSQSQNSLSADPASLDFGNISAGGNSSMNVTLRNNGNSDITISGVTETGAGFGMSGLSSGMTLPPDQTATLTVTFTPGTSESASGSVSVNSNATNSPTVISLTGSSYHVALSWTASLSPDILSYNVYRGTAPGSYTRINQSAITTTQYSDTAVAAKVTYYYAVTGVDSNGVESAMSSPATASIP
jgi:hypothetical protein